MLNAPPKKLSIRSFFMQEGVRRGANPEGEWLKQKTRVKSENKKFKQAVQW